MVLYFFASFDGDWENFWRVQEDQEYQNGLFLPFFDFLTPWIG